MNKRWFIIGMTAAFCYAAQAQNCDLLISSGRAFLQAGNIPHAYTNFAEAVRLCPNHQTGRVFLAATRLLRLPNLPASEAFLNRLGVTSSNRNIYEWTADLSRNTDGQVIFPPGVGADEIVGFFRSNVLSEVESCILDLSIATSSNLLITLSTGETRHAEATLDQGDIRLLRAGLHFGQYLGYTLHAANLQAQLTDLVRLGRGGDLTLESFIAGYPNLLTFANPGDLVLAKNALVDAAARYVEASDLIRARPSNTIRLFNLDVDESEKEMRFRATLADVTNSLHEATVLQVRTNVVLHLGRIHDGTRPLRGFLPRLFGNGFVLGSFPDVTFGGTVLGLTRAEVEETVDKFLRGIPSLEAAAINSQFRGWMNTLRKKPYVLQASDDLFTWYDLLEFVANGSSIPFQETEPTGGRRFYRLVDMEGMASFEGQVLDMCSMAPVAGAIVSTDMDERTAITDANGNFFLLSRTPSDIAWFFRYTIVARGYRVADDTQYGDGRRTVYLSPQSPQPPANDLFTNRIVMTGLPWTTNGMNCGATQEPDEPTGYANSVWFSWTATFTGEVALSLESTGFEFPAQAIAYTGDSLEELEWVADSDFGPVLRLYAETGITYHFAIGSWGPGSHVRLTFGAVPILNVTSPEDGAILSGSAVTIAGTATDPDGRISQIDIYGDYFPLASLTNSPFSYLWSPDPGYHELTVHATDDMGFGAAQYLSFTIRPANDDFTNRTVLAGNNIHLRASTAAATAELEDPVISPDDSGGPSVWFRWNAPFSGPVTIAVQSMPLIGVFTGNALESLDSVATAVTRNPDDYYTYVSFTAAAGAEYAIMIVDYSWSQGGPFMLSILPTAAPSIAITNPPDDAVLPAGAPFLIETSTADPDGQVVRVDFLNYGTLLGIVTNAPFSLLVSNQFSSDMLLQARAFDNSGAIAYSAPVPITLVVPNDYFTNRIAIPGPLPARITGGNFGAGRESGEPTHDGYVASASVWWFWQSTVSGPVTISTIGSNFDTLLAVYTGAIINSLTPVASDDESGGNGTSRVNFTATAGVTYVIAVDGFFGDTGNIVLNISSP